MLHNFRTAPAGPTNSVQWSEDNKVLVITGNEISIVDPRSSHTGLPAILIQHDSQDGKSQRPRLEDVFLDACWSPTRFTVCYP